MEKFIKTPDQIAALIQHWFLHYHGKDREFFSGSEDFTIFDLIPDGLQRGLLQRVNLDENERPVLLLKCDKTTFTLNTTHRFIRISESDLEFIFYADFISHEGYKSISVETKAAAKAIKTDGYFAEFGIKIRSDEILYWSIPSGKPGFAFWNVTKKCELIGRKYL